MTQLKRPKMAGNQNAAKDNPLTDVVKVRVSREQKEWLDSKGNISDTIRRLIDQEMEWEAGD